MASRLTASHRSRSKSLPRSPTQTASFTGPWISTSHGMGESAPLTLSNPQIQQMEAVDRTNQLNEPLLDTDDSIRLIPPSSRDVQNDPKVESGSLGFRGRAKAWRKGMRLPRSRPRRATVYDTFIDSSKNTPHYVKNIVSDNLLARARLRILRGVESGFVRALSLFVLVAYIAFNIVQLVLYKVAIPVYVDQIAQIIELIFVAFFCVEVGLRIIGQGKVFFRRCFEVFDLMVVILSTILTVVYVVAIDQTKRREGTATIVISSLRFIILGRILRVFFWPRVLSEQKSLLTYVRSKVSQNKRRYIDDAFNLDLTYVTDRVIAMSFPSSGSQSLYRNSIQEVGKFLDKMHFGHYRVYNLCSEKEYDTSYFHNQVQRVLIDDHNVPKFTDLVDFCEDVLTWMEGSQENVIVVHCKGGKGRTGMMISAWLVRSGLFEEARDSLEYFTLRRTDKSRGKKTQGVDTPSQSRYVQYYQRLITVMKRNLPPPKSLRLDVLTLHGLSGLGRGDGSDWRFEIYLAADVIFECSLDSPHEKITSVSMDRTTDTVEVVFAPTKPVVLIDDVKFKFYSTNRSLPIGNDKCQFYFWFHTTFVEDNKFYLERDELDNLHKSKLQRCYPVGFAVEIAFEKSDDFSGTYSIIDSNPSNHILVD